MRRILILGSTGSIGTQALDIVRRNRDRFEVVGLAAAGGNPKLLAEEALEFGVGAVALADEFKASELRHLLGSASGATQIFAGPTAVVDLIKAVECDVVLNGITGSVGLGPTLAALEIGRTLALANKESLIIGGPLVIAASAPGQIVPVDSEHSAIAQILAAGTNGEISRLLVTASGGPFFGRSRAELANVTPDAALAHPTWNMGRMVTTNSATLVNKGLEVIEAHYLFDVPFDRIEVVVHPQSIIHSMVEFYDGATIAQLSNPDMRLPIALALDWPHRVPGATPPMSWPSVTDLTFAPVDDEVFPALRLAREVGVAGGTFPAVYNAANEIAVTAFHEGQIGFLDIAETIEKVVGLHAPERGSLSVEGVLAADSWARIEAEKICGLGR